MLDINLQLRQEKSCISKPSSINPRTIQNKQNSGYFIAGLGKEVHMTTNTKMTKEMHKDYSNFWENWVLQRQTFITG